MEQKARTIVIFGGAFNPPHLGHAAIIERTRRHFPCDELWVMPSADRHDKAIDVSATDRIHMLKLMLKESVDSSVPVLISTMETDRTDLSNTFATKQELEAQFPHDRFYFVMGEENLPVIAAKWVKGPELLATTRFIVVERPGAPGISGTDPSCLELIRLPHEGGITLSSTFLRDLVQRGYPLLPYVSPGVAEYIKNQGLYKTID